MRFGSMVMPLGIAANRAERLSIGVVNFTVPARARRSSAASAAPAARLVPECSAVAVLLEALDEFGSQDGFLTAGAGASELGHQRCGAGLRDAEQRLEVAARDQVAFEVPELVDRVGDSEQPSRACRHGPKFSGRPSTLSIGCIVFHRHVLSRWDDEAGVLGPSR